MWCDDFDMDLPKVFTGIQKWFRQPLVMWALCRPAGGKINCPAAWHGLGRNWGLGTIVFVQPFEPTFPRDKHGWVSVGGYTTDDPWVLCNPWDLIRDEWVHGTDVILLHQGLGKIGQLACSRWERDFMTLMHYRRRQFQCGADDAADAGYRALRRLWGCSRVFDRICQIQKGLPCSQS